MRLYILTANWGKGGPGGIAADIYNVASNVGWECRFAYGREVIPENINSYKIGSPISPYVHAASAMLFDNAGFATKKPTIDLINDIKEFKPDIINLHNPLGYTMNMQLLFDYFKSSSIPVVWTMHDIWSITGHCITGLCENWKNGCGKCPNKKEYPASYFLDRSKQNRVRKEKCFSNVPKMTLVSPSRWLANLAAGTYLNQYEIRTIPNGIDLDVFKPTDSELRKKYGLENKTILLSVAGVWAKNKGAEFLYILSKQMDENFAFVMIGENNDKELESNDRIIHIEHTNNRTELAQWYTVADIFINPTMGDNFPTVNLEAIACGTPVITFDTGGSGEAIGNCGTIVEQGNVEKLKKAILEQKKVKTKDCLDQAKNFDKNERYMDYIRLFEQNVGESISL